MFLSGGDLKRVVRGGVPCESWRKLCSERQCKLLVWLREGRNANSRRDRGESSAPGVGRIPCCAERVHPESLYGPQKHLRAFYLETLLSTGRSSPCLFGPLQEPGSGWMGL